jgi:tetratricopeptide (TPR) repeat protein
VENTLTEQEIERFNQLYDKAYALVAHLIILDHQTTFEKVGFFAKLKIEKCIKTLEKALQIYPDSWQCMLVTAKAHQRLGRTENAILWLEKAYAQNPENAHLAKEIGICASQLGKPLLVIHCLADLAKRHTRDAELHISLGCAYLLCQQLRPAKEAFNQALLLEPTNHSHEKLVGLVNYVIAGKIPCPTTHQEIFNHTHPKETL